MPKQYKQLKNIGLRSILELDEGPFQTECLRRLEECGFIEGKEERRYEFGQRFRCHGEVYVLTFLKDNQAALVNIRTGWTWSGIGSVQSSGLVTQAEFDDLTGTVASSDFKLVG